MSIVPDGIDAAAEQELKAHPTTPVGKAITAWKRRAETIKATVAETNRLRSELDQLRGELSARPF